MKSTKVDEIPPEDVKVKVKNGLPMSTIPEGQRPLQIVWRNVIAMSILHCLAVYSIFLAPLTHLYTWIWFLGLFVITDLGISAGAHRLWSHRSYRARLPLRIVLAICNSVAVQNDIIEWCRDHRVHHKFTETDADPHNARRGFFFAHMGWLLVRKHPDVKERGKAIDLSDLFADPVCVFQRKFYIPSVILFCFVMPTLIPWYFWGQTLWASYFICVALRLTVTLHFTWTVNSIAHLWGNKPYDRYINPVENIFVTCSTFGEGFHNYHHVYPTDYSASEHGWRFNFTTMFIDIMAKIGLAYDLKKVSADTVLRRKKKTGDGSSGFGHNLHYLL